MNNSESLSFFFFTSLFFIVVGAVSFVTTKIIQPYFSDGIILSKNTLIMMSLLAFIIYISHIILSKLLRFKRLWVFLCFISIISLPIFAYIKKDISSAFLIGSAAFMCMVLYSLALKKNLVSISSMNILGMVWLLLSVIGAKLNLYPEMLTIPMFISSFCVPMALWKFPKN